MKYACHNVTITNYGVTAKNFADYLLGILAMLEHLLIQWAKLYRG